MRAVSATPIMIYFYNELTPCFAWLVSPQFSAATRLSLSFTNILLILRLRNWHMTQMSSKATMRPRQMKRMVKVLLALEEAQVSW